MVNRGAGGDGSRQVLGGKEANEPDGELINFNSSTESKSTHQSPFTGNSQIDYGDRRSDSHSTRLRTHEKGTNHRPRLRMRGSLGLRKVREDVAAAERSSIVRRRPDAIH